MMFKKITSLLVAAVVMISNLSAVAFADEVPAEEPVYVRMNVPYQDFYKAYSVSDLSVWEVGEGVDGVSTATASKFKGTTGLAKGTYNDGTNILGVTIPVQVSQEDLQKLPEGCSTGENYYYEILETEPKAYSVLTVENDSLEFSGFQTNSEDTASLSITDVTLKSGYGDYQISLGGFNADSNKGIDGISNSEGYTIYGAILKTSDGTSYGTTCLENLWFGTRVPYVEIAWSVPEGKGLKRGHGSGDPFYQFDMNGATLVGVDVITDLGVIPVTGMVALTPYYSGDISEIQPTLVADSTAMKLEGVPEMLENPQVSVSWTTGSGRDQVTNYLIQNAPIVNGVVTLEQVPVLDLEYTVTISSDSMADITLTTAAKSASSITIKAKSVTYTGKTVSVDKAVVTGSTGSVTYSYYSDKACTKAVKAHKNAGTYYVQAKVAADENYAEAVSKVVKVTIKKASQPVKISTATKKVKYNAKKAVSTSKVAVTAKGKVTYKKASGSKALTISKSTGKITVKKGTRKGTYSIKIKVSAASTVNYKSFTKTVTVKVKVK